MILIKKGYKYQDFHHQNLDKIEYLTGREVLPSNQSQIMEKAKYSYSPLGKTLKKQRKILRIKEKKTKTIED